MSNPKVPQAQQAQQVQTPAVVDSHTSALAYFGQAKPLSNSAASGAEDRNTQYAKLLDLENETFVILTGSIEFSESFTDDNGNPQEQARFSVIRQGDVEMWGDEAPRYTVTTTAWRVKNQIRALIEKNDFPVIATVLQDYSAGTNKYGRYPVMLADPAILAQTPTSTPPMEVDTTTDANRQRLTRGR